MEKSYKSGLFIKAFLMLLLFMAIYNMVFVTTINIIIRLLGLCGVVYLVLIMFMGRTIVNTDGIRIEGFNNLVKSKKLDWNDIYMIKEDSMLGIHLYHLIPYDNNNGITITNFISNYKEILKHVIKSASQAKVDESILQLINKQFE